MASRAQGDPLFGRLRRRQALVEPGAADLQRGTEGGERRVRVVGSEGGDHVVALRDCSRSTNFFRRAFSSDSWPQ